MLITLYHKPTTHTLADPLPQAKKYFRNKKEASCTKFLFDATVMNELNHKNPMLKM